VEVLADPRHEEGEGALVLEAVAGHQLLEGEQEGLQGRGSRWVMYLTKFLAWEDDV
jgi:hypothetical protein